jgi:hypothetical protein
MKQVARFHNVVPVLGGGFLTKDMDITSNLG